MKMDISEISLTKEYVDNMRNLIYYPLKVAGISRFDIKGDRIVKRTMSSLIYTTFLMIITNSCAFYIVYELAFIRNYLVVPEIIVVLLFDIFHICVLANITFVNPGTAAQLINAAIEIDTFLGVEETKFMRDISVNTYVLLAGFDGLLNVAILIVLLFTYVVDIPLGVSLVGALYFIVLWFIYYDLTFFLTLYTYLTLRVRYLNVSIMKMTDIPTEYLPNQFPFNTIFWNKKHDDMVDFHTRSEPGKIVHAFRMLFKQLRYLENCYRFTIFLVLSYSTIGTFAIVQNFIIYIKSTNMDIIRLAAITGWCVLSWSVQIGMTQQTDMFYRQIKQTNLICTFIQLKPTYSNEVYKFTRSIIRTLEVRDPRVSIYGLFYYDTGLLVNMFASLFVYITMQLQLAFAKKDDISIASNVSIS